MRIKVQSFDIVEPYNFGFGRESIYQRPSYYSIFPFNVKCHGKALLPFVIVEYSRKIRCGNDEHLEEYFGLGTAFSSARSFWKELWCAFVEKENCEQIPEGSLFYYEDGSQAVLETGPVMDMVTLDKFETLYCEFCPVVQDVREFDRVARVGLSSEQMQMLKTWGPRTGNLDWDNEDFRNEIPKDKISSIMNS